MSASRVPDYTAHLGSLALTAEDTPNILAAVKYSAEQLAQARQCLADFTTQGMMASAVGSLGRYEATRGSDLDLALVYDDAICDEADAVAFAEHATAALGGAGFDVSKKIFGVPLAQTTLLRNIGGMREESQQMTYRVLLLTEQAWVCNPQMSDALRTRIFGIYKDGSVSRGKHLTSLSNDLQRYYRTLCVDYRFKVEEGAQPWALRVMKLRHSRKLWHLGNLAVQCLGVVEEENNSPGRFDELLASRIGMAPLIKVLESLTELQGASICSELMLRYDWFLGQLGQDHVRAELEALAPARRDESALYAAFRQNATAFQDAAGTVVDYLYQACPNYFRRYAIL